jgi:hypothetical protein
MEPAENPPRLPSLQKSVQGLHKVRWLGKLWRSMTGHGGQPMSGGNGSKPENNGKPHSGISANAPVDDRDIFISVMVGEAIARGEELAKHEAGASYGRICPPLLAGPQRYRDPSVWGPNYRLLAPWSTETPEQIEVMANTPLHLDQRYREISHLTYQRAVELGLPGTLG